MRDEMKASEEMKASRGSLANVLLSILGYRYRSVAFAGCKLTLSGWAPRELTLSELSGPTSVSKRLGFSALVLPLKGDAKIVVAGLKLADATDMVSTVNAAWRRYYSEQFSRVDEELQFLAEAVGRLKNPRRYPSACLLEPFLERATQVLAQLPTDIPEGVLSGSQLEKLEAVRRFKETPDHLRSNAIEAFIDTELVETREFLDTIESNPLTPEQRLAVLTDEDATLVLAGAGSGKTSVIVAKAAYLIQRGIRKPQEVLLMAFGKDAAAEMATRIEERSGAAVDALTFHALGYEIIREVENGAPALAAHSSDEAQFRALLRDILLNDVATQSGLAAHLLKWFSEFYVPYKSEWDFKTKGEYFQYVEAQELRTLQGELVRSFEELEIANWLYLNGVAYEYEPDYEHSLPENTRKAYTPDFRLTESGVYIEHFGVRKSVGSDGAVSFTTAPYVDRASYLEGMQWKREVHQKHGTTLIETYSYERVEECLTEALKEKLSPHVTFEPLPPERIYEQLSKMGLIDTFTQTLGTFLKHFKSSGGSIEICQRRAQKSKDKARSLAFLKIFDPLYQSYQKRLGTRIDFEDMTVRATGYVKTGQYRSPYCHLLVDEFQDISEGRAQLLLALKEQHADARIFAVGDDWQSIYRFTGADIHLMRHFGQEFGGMFAGKGAIHSVVDLGRTFRSVDKIALPARSFVLKNPAQIEKQVVPAGTSDSPAISLAYYTRGKEDFTLHSALENIQLVSNGSKTSVLLLGRYNFLKPKNTGQFTATYPQLSVRFMTVHGSKGLEADHVVIIRASSGRMGFPSEVVDDPLLDLVLPEPENFDHAEERRLFYVALTRAKHSVTVLADRDEPSVFVRELASNAEFGAVELGQPGIAERKCSSCGARMLAQTSKNGRTYFSCEHRFLCGELSRPCSECRKDLPVANPIDPNKLICSCGAKFPACEECSDGWLVERSGRYGKFLGCVNYPECDGKQRIAKQKIKSQLSN